MLLVQYLIALSLFFAMVFSAPLLPRDSEEKSETNSTAPTLIVKNETLPDISAPIRVNYETLGGGFEGDMIFPFGSNPIKASQARGVAIAGPRRWSNNVIPYDLSAITSSADRDMIEYAIRTLMYAVATPIQGQLDRTSCVYFRPRLASDRYYVRLVYGSGCSGTVGFSPNTVNELTLAPVGCFTPGIIQHELLHILGFYHEQSRPDRDSYITINYDNIEELMEYNFDKFQWGSEVLNQNSPYDYGSIMHYGPTDFSKNTLPTIVPKRRATIGQREGLSEIDIAEVRAYYSCQ